MTTIPLSGDYVHVPGQFNLNGIVATPDGKTLIAVQSVAKKLFTIDPETGVASEIDLGGYDLVNGDGLLLHGRTLYVVQNRINKVAVFELSPHLTTATFVRALTDPDLDVPTTIDPGRQPALRRQRASARRRLPTRPTTSCGSAEGDGRALPLARARATGGAGGRGREAGHPSRSNPVREHGHPHRASGSTPSPSRLRRARNGRAGARRPPSLGPERVLGLRAADQATASPSIVELRTQLELLLEVGRTDQGGARDARRALQAVEAVAGTSRCTAESTTTPFGRSSTKARYQHGRTKAAGCAPQSLRASVTARRQRRLVGADDCEPVVVVRALGAVGSGPRRPRAVQARVQSRPVAVDAQRKAWPSPCTQL